MCSKRSSASIISLGKGRLTVDGAKFWVDVIKEVGFPIFVTCYLLIRLDKMLACMLKLLRHIDDNINKGV
jgi:hypothetical protein